MPDLHPAEWAALATIAVALALVVRFGFRRYARSSPARYPAADGCDVDRLRASMAAVWYLARRRADDAGDNRAALRTIADECESAMPELTRPPFRAENRRERGGQNP